MSDSTSRPGGGCAGLAIRMVELEVVRQFKHSLFQIPESLSNFQPLPMTHQDVEWTDLFTDGTALESSQDLLRGE